MSAGTREGATLVDHQGQVVELRHRVTDLAAKVAEAEAEAREVIRVAHLEEILDIAHEHGGEDGGDSGVTCVGCQRILVLADSALALSSPSPSAQALTQLVEAVKKWDQVALLERDGDAYWRLPLHIKDEGDGVDISHLWQDMGDAYRALLAARSGRGEGE